MDKKNLSKPNLIANKVSQSEQPQQKPINVQEQTKNPNMESMRWRKIIEQTGYPLTEDNIEEYRTFWGAENIKQQREKIKETEKEIANRWAFKQKAKEFQQNHLSLPNATVSNYYVFTLSADLLEQYEIRQIHWKIPENLGIQSNDDNQLVGTPKEAGEYDLTLRFLLEGEDNSEEVHEKKLKLTVTPDPKTLWKNIETDKTAIFYKEDNRYESGKLGSKHYIVASNRGRSHQNNGSFRDDDFSTHFDKLSGWGVVAVSDGAGSASLSREGSRVACESIIEFLFPKDDETYLAEFDKQLHEYINKPNEENKKQTKILAKKTLYPACVHAHTQLIELAKQTHKTRPELFSNNKKRISDYFHATLIFAVFKEVKNLGYVILTFGVGDCPIGLVTGDKAQLLNWLDVGEFGGGTRFITQSEIFQAEEMASRFKMHIVDNFDFLFLMTDGVYDAKFEVEANLEKNEKWQDFINDLKGNNEDHVGINFDAESNNDTAEQLSQWLNFWSKGNHDDRTLCVIY